MNEDHKPYDTSRPFDADELMGGFTEERREVPVDPDSELGKVMARAREAWAQNGRPPSPDDFVFPEPIPVDLDE